MNKSHILKLICNTLQSLSDYTYKDIENISPSIKLTDLSAVESKMVFETAKRR